MPPPPPPSSALATTAIGSTSSWQNDLKLLFEDARSRFPDVVWELVQDERGKVEEVWGHKAIVYARAPPSFLARYFDVRPAGSYSHLDLTSPVHNLGLPTQSTFSLGLPNDMPLVSRTPSPYRTANDESPTPSSSPPTGSLLRLATSISPSLFSNQLEYLYTGRGIGAAFEFLFDSIEGDESAGEANVEAARVDKLRKDLVFMWRSRLYSDVRIQLTGAFSSSIDSEEATAVFSSHRFILASRSPYFHTLFLSNFATPQTLNASSPITITLPSPPFTPASLHFTLGYIYTGTLYFSHRTFDLTTALHIYRSASYLSLIALQAELEARVVEEMLHGLFHAYLPFEEYEKITGGRWGVGGCKCKSCTRRVPRVLEFAISDDVKNVILDRGARRALVGMFGEGWVSPEFAGLPAKSRGTALKGVQTRTTPQNLIPLLFAAEAALIKLESPGCNDQPWTELVRDLILQERKKIDDVLCSRCEEIFEQEEWLAILERDGSQFEDGRKVAWTMDSLLRGLADSNAGIVYQNLVSSVLIRPHPTSASAHASTLLSSTSLIRSQVERTRIEILRWLRKRWVGVRLVNGFDTLEGWALKEISDELEVPADDLIAPISAQDGPVTRSGLHVTVGSSVSRADRDAETNSITSLRASVLNRNAAARVGGTSADTQPRESLLDSSASSTRSSIVSSITSPRTGTSGMRSVSSTASQSTSSTQWSGSRPISSSSRASVASSSLRSAPVSPRDGRVTSRPSGEGRPNPSPRRALPEKPSLTTPPPGRSASRASSVASVRSTTSTSTLRKASASSPRAPRISGSSMTAGAPTPHARSAARTSPSTLPVPRSRTLSTASSTSNTSTRSGVSALAAPRESRVRRISATSNASVTSSNGGPAHSVKSAKGSSMTAINRKPGEATNAGRNARPASTVSNASGTMSVAERRKMFQVNAVPATTAPAVSFPTNKVQGDSAPSAPRELEVVVPTVPNPHSTTQPSPSHTVNAKSESSTIRGPTGPKTIRRKDSTDTITKSTGTPRGSTIGTPRASIIVDERFDRVPSISATQRPLQQTQIQIQLPAQALRGVTLNIGIPCMITSKRSRFKAFARYIGEVQGEHGPWVGVEVPVGETWGPDRLDGRDWNDGSIGGVRYFEIGANSSLGLEEGEERAARRRRLEFLGISGEKNGPIASGVTNWRKREADQLSVDQDRLKRMRSVSPAISDMSTMESRGLFVRPQQIILVMDAQEQD